MASDSECSLQYSSGSNTSDAGDHDQSPPSPISSPGECANTQLPSKPKLKKSVSWAATEHNLCKVKSIAQIDLQLQASYRFNSTGDRRGRGSREGDDDEEEELECGYHSDTESSTSDGYVGSTDSTFSSGSSWTTGSDEEEEEEERSLVFGEMIQDAQGRYGSGTRGFDEEMLPAKPMRGYFATRVVDVIEDEENINVEGECEEVWKMWMSE